MIAPDAVDTVFATRLDRWAVAPCAPGTVADPADEAFHALEWSTVDGVGTVAAALRQLDQWHDEPATNLDAHDWWFRTSFPGDTHPIPEMLRFGGLATLADVWLNGEHILSSDNMFMEHHVPAAIADGNNDLVMRFASVDAWLKTRRPRGRWRTRLVNQQQLRWLRSSLLGRVRAWMPPAAVVGPWRPVEVLAGVGISISLVDVDVSIHGTEGRVGVKVELEGDVHGARLLVGEHRANLGVTQRSGRITVLGELSIPNPELWWPHTHGAPRRYDAAIELDVDGHTTTVTLPAVGFRRIETVTDHDDFQVVVNGQPVFCRGACLTHVDPIGLAEDAHQLRAVLETARDGGLNMIRIVGTATWESETFYNLCDELGIMVWQDCPFANMDYPADDETFTASVVAEATQNLRRLKRHASLAVVCGGSEVFQQAAMLGLPEDVWNHSLFESTLREVVETVRCNVPYVAGSPVGGSLPFHVGAGVAHYFGIGAYRRPIADARLSEIRFASECLGFSNIPEPETTERMPSGGLVHLPDWKAGVPRDAGAGWDFEDVRDHYLEQLFEVDPVDLRYADPERYLQLSRVVSAEVIAQAFSEWRGMHNTCHGGLIWMLRDLRPGAGWGLFDVYDRPKAPYWFLRRLFAPLSVAITDHGLDGPRVHITNETHTDESLELQVSLLRENGQEVAGGSTSLEVPGVSTVMAEVDHMVGRFADAGWAYRFGPRPHEVVAVALVDADGAARSRGFHYLSPCAEPRPDVNLSASARETEHGVEVFVESTGVARAVHLRADGWRLTDNYFTVTPQYPVTVKAFPVSEDTRFRMTATALNAAFPVNVEMAG